jgi:adenosylhomocysteine nucleosidase
METIGLIAAMTQESNALLRLIKGWKRISFGQFRGVRFKSKNFDCLLIITGWGRERAGDATRVLLAEASPQVLISFGIAGAVNSDLQIGDVVVSSKSYLLENGIPGRSESLSPFSEAAWNAIGNVLHAKKANLYKGTAITTHGAQVVLQQTEDLPYPVLEMETAGIVQAAAESGVPVVSIRSISDNPQVPIPIDLEAAMDENDNLRIDRLIMMTLRNPKIIFQSGQMMKNTRIAAEHAALAVTAVLGEHSPIVNK